jgi:lipopolysaccharide transport system permease protein
MDARSSSYPALRLGSKVRRDGIISGVILLIKSWPRLWQSTCDVIRQKYIGSVFGSVWIFIFPLIQLTVFAVLYALIFRIRPNGLSEWEYVLFVFSGLVPLLAFSESLTTAASSLLANKGLLLNTVFPAELIPLRAALASQVSGVAAMIITIILAVSIGRANIVTIAAVPVAWILLLMFVVGFGWVLSLLSLVSKDVQYFLGLVIMVLMIASPYAYTPEMVPGALKPLLYVNPLAYYVRIFQSLICFGQWPPFGDSLVAVGLSLASFFGGFALFRKVKRVFFDYA